MTFPSFQLRRARVSGGSNKKSFAIKLFQFCDLKTQQRYIIREEVNISEWNSLLFSTVCAIFSKLLIKLASVYRFPYRSPKLRLDLQSQKTISSLITITISLNTQMDKFVYRFDLETTILAYFPSKSLNYKAINLSLQKLSTLTIAKFTISTRTYFTLQTSVKYLRAIPMCSSFTRGCGYDNSTYFLLGDVNFPNTNCSGKLCMHKKTFQSLGRSDCQCPQRASVCQVRNIFFEDQTHSFCRLVKGFTFLKRLQNQFKMFLEMRIFLASFVPTERLANLLTVI